MPLDSFGCMGQVGRPGDVVDLTMTLDTSAYASADVIADTQEIERAVRFDGGRALLQSLTIIDEDDQGVAFSVVFFRSNVAFGTENSAPNISDANAREIAGWVPVATTDYIDVGGAKVACIRNIGLLLEAVAGSTSLWVAILNGAGTPTYTASGLKMRFGFQWD